MIIGCKYNQNQPKSHTFLYFVTNLLVTRYSELSRTALVFQRVGDGGHHSHLFDVRSVVVTVGD